MNARLLGDVIGEGFWAVVKALYRCVNARLCEKYTLGKVCRYEGVPRGRWLHSVQYPVYCIYLTYVFEEEKTEV